MIFISMAAFQEGVGEEGKTNMGAGEEEAQRAGRRIKRVEGLRRQKVGEALETQRKEGGRDAREPLLPEPQGCQR